MPCSDIGYSDTSWRSEWIAAERAACYARWLVLQLVQAHDPPDNLRPHVARLRDVQLVHRRQDQCQRLTAIAKKIQEIADRAERLCRMGGTPSVDMARQLEQWELERVRTESLTDDELLEGCWITESQVVA